jgi:hypothetical protein
MAQLENRIENALNETRILLLGSQVVIGVLLRAFFEPGFQRLPWRGEIALLIATLVFTAVVGILIWPAAFHQIAQQGEETSYIATFTSTILGWTLLPVAIALGLSLYATALDMHVPGAWVYAVVSAVVGLGVWYALPGLRHDPERRERVHRQTQMQEEEQKREGKTELPQRIKNVLTECRMALPGAQALLGFQFIDVFFDSFAKLPRSLQWVHFASLLCTMVATILLIAPAAYHRIAEGGEDTEHFLKVASRMLLWALVFLAPGMTGDIIVAMYRVMGSVVPGIVVSVVFLVAFYALWFGYSAWARERSSHA